MYSQNALIELLHIQLELGHGRSQHMRHFIDQYYCYQHGLVTSSGKANWSKLLWHGYVSSLAVLESDKKQLVKEHVVPLKVIVEKLIALSADKAPSLEEIAACIDENLIFATITKEEDKRLRDAKLNSRMPDGYYQAGHSLFNDKFARYRVANIQLTECQNQSN
ncbi:hypothetical protein L2725_00525 [Shewanella corallii]|uniref:Uncharacterized protein n=1 Tax=Shewanella corallii TaxID=560080 RepID=A0ABT0N3A8_9GAMM|nr:hypothetical protein [Shewanella corallii]MCL2912277.1 hypothetical protein [Shewanella corallii]